MNEDAELFDFPEFRGYTSIMQIKTPTSLTVAGLFLKIIAWVIIVLSLGEFKSSHNSGLVIFLELFGIGLFIVAWKMQNKMKEWARLTSWGFALLAGGYFILNYFIKISQTHQLTASLRTELILGFCFITLAVYLNQPRIKRIFQLSKQSR